MSVWARGDLKTCRCRKYHPESLCYTFFSYAGLMLAMALPVLWWCPAALTETYLSLSVYIGGKIRCCDSRHWAQGELLIMNISFSPKHHFSTFHPSPLPSLVHSLTVALPNCPPPINVAISYTKRKKNSNLVHMIGVIHLVLTLEPNLRFALAGPLSHASPTAITPFVHIITLLSTHKSCRITFQTERYLHGLLVPVISFYPYRPTVHIRHTIYRDVYCLSRQFSPIWIWMEHPKIP